MRIGFLLFDNLTQLDLMGPLQVLSRLPNVEAITIAETLQAVQTDCPVQFLPSDDFNSAGHLDMICVPGGFGIKKALENDRFMAFLTQKGEAAQYVTSVCTGALLIGAAGFLQGKRATTHWAYRDLLSDCGAKYENDRFVRDGTVFTGGGVTAGIDFAFAIAMELYEADIAQTLQLGLEYDPAPPLDFGHPDKADPEIFQKLTAHYAKPVSETQTALLTRLSSRN